MTRIALLALLCLAAPVAAEDRIAARCRNASVTVLVQTWKDWLWFRLPSKPMPQGSGTLFRDQEGIVWVITAAHVIPEDCAGVELMQFQPDPDGSGKLVIHGGAATIHKLCRKHDLALLRIGKLDPKDFFPACAQAYAGKLPPGRDTRVIHVGSYHGQHHHSTAWGQIQWVGELYEGMVWDRADFTLFGGSSGGGVFLRRGGRWIGVTTHGAGCRLAHFVPVRRVRAWLEEQGYGHVLRGRK